MTARPAEYDLSVVVPAYNEARRIVEPLRRIDGYLRGRGIAAELVVVDDGSSDGTADVVRALATELSAPVRVIGTTPNRGKGHAVKVGMTHAGGRAVLMTDADLSTPIEEVDGFLAALNDGAQVVIGSRKVAGAVIEVHQPLLREAMGRVFTALTRLLVVRVSDVTCGFKLFTRAAAIDIFSRVTLDDWSFDAEALYLARRLGYRIHEIPVRWRDAEGTKVRRGRDALRAAVGLARILLNALGGRYALGRRGAAAPGAEAEDDRAAGGRP
jgi:dolichyl-phosphate beta-glucosyltransferase